jgi:hypothetical protein
MPQLYIFLVYFQIGNDNIKIFSFLMQYSSLNLLDKRNAFKKYYVTFSKKFGYCNEKICYFKKKNEIY